MARISHNINLNELENTTKWYFNYENIVNANDNILKFLSNFNLFKLFKKNKEDTHTSSDGQKFGIKVESLNSNYSYKYFGKGEGVSVYSLIDETHKLFYSTVISSSEKKAAYVINGLMHNEIVQSNIH